MSTDIEQELRGAMERFTGDVRVPPGLAVKAYRHQQKRRVTTRAVAVAGTVAVAAGGVAVAGAAGAFGSASGAPVQTAYTAYVVSHVEHALASPDMNNVLEQDRTVFAAGNSLQPVPTGLVGSAPGSGGRSYWPVSSSLNWSYRGTTRFSAFTAAGQPEFDLGLSVAHRTLSATAVFYRNHTWWTSTPGIRLPGRNGGPPSGCVRGQDIVLRSGQGNGWPGFIRSQLACGAYTVVGRQVVGGVDAIKITGASGAFTFWVNPATYLPVQMTLPQQRTEFQWLSPTPANLAHLKVAAPAGFKQVPAPPEQPVR
jgi:hypothetical protein